MMTAMLQELLNIALEEDIPQGDITSALMIDKDIPITAQLIAKEEGIFFGQAIIDTIFSVLNSTPTITHHVHDGDPVKNKTLICTLEGPVTTLLKAERVLLNFIQRLSGIATTTNRYITTLNNPNIAILDTRKTTPLFRDLEKAAVVAGGGQNHRHSLSDMVLIKENHLEAYLKNHPPESLGTLFKSFKEQNPDTLIEIEIESIDQLRTYDLKQVDIIMLDNFKREDIPKAATCIQEKGYQAEIEVSGNITLETIANYRDLPIHRISIGSLTHSVKALDLSLLFQ